MIKWILSISISLFVLVIILAIIFLKQTNYPIINNLISVATPPFLENNSFISVGNQSRIIEVKADDEIAQTLLKDAGLLDSNGVFVDTDRKEVKKVRVVLTDMLDKADFVVSLLVNGQDEEAVSSRGWIEGDTMVVQIKVSNIYRNDRINVATKNAYLNRQLLYYFFIYNPQYRDISPKDRDAQIDKLINRMLLKYKERWILSIL